MSQQSTTMLWGADKKSVKTVGAWGKRWAWFSCKKTHDCHK
eukprot:CAMPEP_0173377570 /NCGR_PEP_ID=MMETSP1356-20130122/819_1 /TAXON_ID=77927 ORGANISM="Hemiselmis virescens, Strain PCC157" /NCGR_SAMPLE_ID=MMETSP1356 /ASSEMBLY_ACC=CAM_ASM_000847 /LENGTH=40 /DNA_ID= /DNA_START= /DNA_END= /DNA_ORIENTATION=